MSIIDITVENCGPCKALKSGLSAMIEQNSLATPPYFTFIKETVSALNAVE